MTKWFKYTWVCTGECDALIEYTLQSGYTANETNLTCLCGDLATLLSVEDATIQPTTTKEETMEATGTFLQSQIDELKKQLSNHQNCDYWKSENGRVQGQLIELINDSYENDSDASDILKSICEIIDYEPKREVSFTALIRVEGRADVPYGEDVEEFLSNIEFSVDAYNGDVILDNDYLESVEEN